MEDLVKHVYLTSFTLIFIIFVLVFRFYYIAIYISHITTLYLIIYYVYLFIYRRIYMWMANGEYNVITLRCDVYYSNHKTYQNILLFLLFYSILLSLNWLLVKRIWLGWIFILYYNLFIFIIFLLYYVVNDMKSLFRSILCFVQFSDERCCYPIYIYIYIFITLMLSVELILINQ